MGVIVLRQHRMVVVGRQEGYVDADTLITWLKNTVTEYEAFIVAARADRDERNSTREIRNEQVKQDYFITYKCVATLIL